MQLITGDSRPSKIDDLYAYNLFRSSRCFIVCREPSFYTLCQVPTDEGRALLVQADPASDVGVELLVSRSAWERWLVYPGLPFGKIRNLVFDRALIASTWGRILPLGLGAPRLRLIDATEDVRMLAVEDRRELATAIFPPSMVVAEEADDPMPTLATRVAVPEGSVYAPGRDGPDHDGDGSDAAPGDGPGRPGGGGSA